MFLRHRTAGQGVLLGPFTSSLDGLVLKTDLSIADEDLHLSLSDGVSFPKSPGGVSHKRGGMYAATLSDSDTSSIGKLRIIVKATDSRRVLGDFHVLPQEMYDGLFSRKSKGWPSSKLLDDARNGSSVSVKLGGRASDDNVALIEYDSGEYTVTWLSNEVRATSNVCLSIRIIKRPDGTGLASPEAMAEIAGVGSTNFVFMKFMQQ